jgi:hypothetical protein
MGGTRALDHPGLLGNGHKDGLTTTVAQHHCNNITTICPTSSHFPCPVHHPTTINVTTMQMTTFARTTTMKKTNPLLQCVMKRYLIISTWHVSISWQELEGRVL